MVALDMPMLDAGCLMLDKDPDRKIIEVISKKKLKIKQGDKMKRIFRIIIILVLLLTLVSCLAVKGGDSEGKSAAEPTLGRELIDLKKAKDVGAISMQEYTQLKEMLIKSYQ